MALIKINDNPSRRELRQFAAIWFPLFCFIAGGLLYLAGSRGGGVAAAVIGVAFGLLGYRRPAFIHPLYLIWMYAAYPIGYVISHLMLGIVFYGVLTPIGAAMKLVGYDPLNRRLRSGESSYWTRSVAIADKTEYFRQF